MGIKANTKGITAARSRLKNTGVEVMRDSAAACQEKAQKEARHDTGTMRRMIVLLPTPKGARVESQAHYSAFNEYGTGIYGERPGRQTPWVYSPDGGKTFYTTQGMRPKAFMRPGFREGVDHFHDARRRRKL